MPRLSRLDSSRRADRALVVSLLLLATACGRAPDTPPASSAPAERARWLLVGIDGADWDVLHRLWEKGEAPTLRRLAESGSSAVLRTAYEASPVIWTTIVTGAEPEVHGIEDFVVAGPTGDRPVSSETRRVPALWNLLSASEITSAWLGWWATWPAETIDGIVVSDRALETDDRAVSPRAFEPTFRSLADEASSPSTPLSLPASGVAGRDRTMVWVGRRLLLDRAARLVAVYFRSLDIESHFSWKYHQPDRFDVPEDERQRVGDPVERIYRQVDEALSLLLEAAGPATNVVVLSDHGFRALPRERVVVQLDFDRVLERIGYLRRDAEGIDLAASHVYTWASRPAAVNKQLRLGGAAPADPQQRARFVTELERALAAVTWRSGEPAFELRPPDREASRRGADLVVHVKRAWADDALLLDGDELEVDLAVSRISGSHGRSTHGILIAAGPDIACEADLDGISIHDIAPTLAWALGVPLAEDRIGRVRTALLDEGTRPPLRTVATWGTRSSTTDTTLPGDEENLRQLRALGYIE